MAFNLLTDFSTEPIEAGKGGEGGDFQITNAGFIAAVFPDLNTPTIVHFVLPTTFHKGTTIMTDASPTPNPFDPAALRITSTTEGDLGVRKLLIHVPVQKPKKQAFFRAHPGDEYKLQMAILNLKDEGEVYAVSPQVALSVPGETSIVALRLCITQQGSIFMWPVPLPTAEGRENAWHHTARIAAEHAETNWVRMIANMSAGCYDVKIAPPGMPDPEWPTESLADLLPIAFGNGKLIDSLDHPVIKRLMGI